MFPPKPGDRLNNGATCLAATPLRDSQEAIVLAQWKAGEYVTWHGYATSRTADEPMYLSGDYFEPHEHAAALDAYHARVAQAQPSRT